jgi:hypothetical protein
MGDGCRHDGRPHHDTWQLRHCRRRLSISTVFFDLRILFLPKSLDDFWKQDVQQGAV